MADGHLEHIEELIFNEGVEGTRKAILFLKDLRDQFSGHVSRSNNLTVKWDGAPAIFVGVDPEDDQFFVSKKGIFNKNPVVYKSEKDIKDALSGDLEKKFTIAFKEFQKLGIKKGIYQGDLMFTKGDIKKEKIQGEQYLTFQPNTIVYAVPTKSSLARDILKAKIGVVWHTSYSGKDLKSLKASFGDDIVRQMKKTSSVWMDDATFKDVSGTATFTAQETKEFSSLLSKAGSLFNKITASTFDAVQRNSGKVKQYNNANVREGKPFANPRGHVKGLYNYMNYYYDSEIESKKSEKGKQTWRDKKKESMKMFENPSELHALFELMGVLIDAKSMIIDKLNQASSMNTFLRTRRGLETTNQEGFVGVDRIGNAIKLVDRLEFSRANFSPDILKGWDK